MILRSLLLTLAAITCLADDAPPPSAPEATPAYWERPDVQAFIDEMATQHGFDRAALVQQFAQVTLKPNILAVLDKPSTSRPYHAFRPDFVNDTRLRLGVAYWQANAPLLQAVSDQYGVEPEYLVAILGVETLWGRNTGSFRVMDALGTIAFDYPRRADFFRKELREFLLLARDEQADPFEFKGSYAGAMGAPQFMPSSFHAYAADWDKDGRHDIWNNQGDILASVANYFVQHGWQRGEPLLVPATVEGEGYAPLVADKFNLHYKVSELAAFGVRPSEPLNGDPLAVLAPLEHEPGVTRYWLGLANFYAITRYNRSTHYAMAVHELAQRIKAAYHDPSLLPKVEAPKRKPAKPKKKSGKRRK
ncbi:lytic murein transglycosylase B [Chitinimonas viridis]|uniref:Lytic murein transglycosylase B n=1 Tax=Chitinimonas viridis TaxID=664880 RepID=A0ABT8BC73_9NEIS|nr:lytic murein transglycosylase B [Chitinimonas viridis]MDN3579118.1 lytic murein transglycosylase B [Chitinimonas viridis]